MLSSNQSYTWQLDKKEWITDRWTEQLQQSEINGETDIKETQWLHIAPSFPRLGFHLCIFYANHDG